MSLTSRFYDMLVECDMMRNYFPIFDFVRDESRKIYFEKEKREFVALIPEIVRHVNWLNNLRVKSYPGYNEALKEGLYSCDLYDNGLMYSAIFSRVEDKSFYDKELIEFLASRELDPADIIYMVKDMCMQNVEMASLFLKKLNIKMDSKMAMEIVDAINSGCAYGFVRGRPPLMENLDKFMDAVDNLVNLYMKVSVLEGKERIKGRIEERVDEVLPTVTPYQILKVVKICDDPEKKDKAVKYAVDHFDSIVNDYPPGYMFDVIFKDIDGIPELEKKRDEYVNEHFKELVEGIYFSMNEISKEDARRLESNPDREVIIDILGMVFEEVCKNEGVNFSDIRRIGRGGFTDVYQVGEKVVKIGRGRGNSKFPNNPYIISPLMRKDFGFKNGKKYENAYVEVTERVDTLTEADVSEEELYQLYSRMREIGLEWMDIEARNVGLLRRDNRIYWSEDLDPTDEALGLAPRVGAGVHLKKGDLVILDADFIYEEGSVPEAYLNANEDEEFTFIRTWKEFNERYNKEHYYGKKSGSK